MAWRRALVVLTSKPLATNLRAWWAIPIAASTFTSMASAISYFLTFPFTCQILIARNLFLQAPTPTSFNDNSPASLNALASMASLRATMKPAAQHLITSGSTEWHRDITSHPFIHPLPTRACPPSLKWALTTLTRMTTFTARMLPTPKHSPTRDLTPKDPIAALPLVFYLSTLTPINTASLTRRARAIMTSIRTPVNPTIQ